MSDAYSTVMVATVLLVLICGWLLVNALIDLSARHVRRFWEARRSARPSDIGDSGIEHSRATGFVSRGH